mmetsp:Transcript_40399/g.116110  ORF Transcript_40399/g.116110 Transcript_40399/m.116110 type:complete len:353 (-) Transcript_40399:350-1408(-)
MAFSSLRRAAAAALLVVAASADGDVPEALEQSWEKLSDGPWGPREGLMVASVGDKMVLTGGRGTYGVGFSGGDDVWRSTDGRTWEKAPEGKWARRAYHILIGPDDKGCIYLMGGQTLSEFFNDVWSSCDGGDSWALVRASAEWQPRAGLGGVLHKNKLFVAGGCHDDVKYDPGLFRQFYSDVWSSENGGKTWDLVSDSPGWKGRSGPRLVSFQDKLFIVAGEVGFTTKTQLADVWSSADDGKTWTVVTAQPAYSARSGHGVVTYGDYMIMVAGWPELSDLYYTKDGAEWTKSGGLAWNCNSTKCGKFDFWPLVHKGRLFTIGGSGSSSTFGKLYADTWAIDLPSRSAQTVVV